MKKSTTLSAEVSITIPLEIPEGYTEEEYLRKVAVDKFYARRISKIADDTAYASEGLAKEVDALLEETASAAENGRARSLLAVSLYHEKNPDIPVSLGRGSASGLTHLMYALGLSDLDPASSLLFERFLDPSRVYPPDIDTNFDDKVRRKTMKYLEKKYMKRDGFFKRIAKRLFKR